jgi:cellulose biosynthesis protein BcsQ
LAFHCATEFASRGYKTVLVDLDPQCNLTLQCLGGDYFEPNLLSGSVGDIGTVLAKRLE